MSDRPCQRCALAPGFTVCRRCLVAVLKGDTSPAARWVAFAWAVAMAFASAGLMVLLEAHGLLAWTLAVAAIGGGALLGAVLTEQRGIHPLAPMEIIEPHNDEQRDAT
ncbi:hypothetical protein L2Y96_11300 [Luteibacter aegosomaticola]|uniref:hypothetical protein n=1 Tax=Luteibacter aegosomaticola TaxID=2911538 RepID=UPI001FFB4BFF|nr:hypothetical protein [Luteibacter aegosomaticola]UPG88008.1 hypothetical protein L2Y96_11300 [Luteibacter aegosomaticola]